MKFLNTVIISFLSLSSADADSRNDLQNDVYRSLNEVRQILDRVEDSVRRLPPNLLERRLGDLEEVKQILRSQGHGGPGRRYAIMGTIENTDFSFDVSSAVDFASLCIGQFSSLTKADDATIQVNFGPTRTLRNSTSYWDSTGEICAVIAEAAVSLGVPAVSRPGGGVAVGAMEKFTFNLNASNQRELYDSCLNFYNRTSVGKVDDIVVFSANGLVVRKRNSTSYWNTGHEVCSILVGTYFN